MERERHVLSEWKSVRRCRIHSALSTAATALCRWLLTITGAARNKEGEDCDIAEYGGSRLRLPASSAEVGSSTVEGVTWLVSDKVKKHLWKA